MQAFISEVLSHVEIMLHAIGFGRIARNLCKPFYQKCSAMLNLYRLIMTHHAGRVPGAVGLGSLFTKKGMLKTFKARARANAKGKGKAKPGTKAKAKAKPAADAPAASASAESPAASAEPAAESPAASASAESEPAAEAPAASASAESEPAAEAPAEKAKTKPKAGASAKAEPKGKAKAKAKAKAVAGVAAADAEVPSAVEADVKPSAVETPTAPSGVFCSWCNLPCEPHSGRYTTKSRHSQTSCLLLYDNTFTPQSLPALRHPQSA
jgi:hypothetical protein